VLVPEHQEFQTSTVPAPAQPIPVWFETEQCRAGNGGHARSLKLGRLKQAMMRRLSPLSRPRPVVVTPGRMLRRAAVEQVRMVFDA
jgi:hypothetical protein